MHVTVSFAEQARTLRRAFLAVPARATGAGGKAIWRPALYMFLFAACPSTWVALFYFLTNNRHFGTRSITVITTAKSASHLLAILCPFFGILLCVSNMLGTKHLFQGPN